MNALIHFGMATFFHDCDPGCTSTNWQGCDSNGGCNSSDPRSFNPTKLNVSNWVESFKAVGVTSAVLTAKHGCGFLAWETATTLPDGSPYRYHVPPQYPVLKDFVAAMQQNGIGYGFYYSLTNVGPVMLILAGFAVAACVDGASIDVGGAILPPLAYLPPPFLSSPPHRTFT
jgi:hypothetical protein